MKIQTAAVLGAGAIGTYILANLQEKMGENLWVIAQGERRKRLEEQGIFVNGKPLTLTIKTPKEAKGVDLLIVAVKYGALEAALDDIAEMVDTHTVVMSLLNGTDSEERIGARIGMEHMVYSLIKMSSLRRGNQISFQSVLTDGGVFYGEAGTKEVTERLQAIDELFDGTAIPHHLCPNIMQDIWYKYALNITRNIPQAIISCGTGAYDASEYLKYIQKKLREEVTAVAAAKGVDISDTNAAGAKGNCLNPAARLSTLQDLDAGRATEIDMFCGAMVRMGKENGVETPFNEMAYYLVKTLEEKNAGKFAF